MVIIVIIKIIKFKYSSSVVIIKKINVLIFFKYPRVFYDNYCVLFSSSFYQDDTRSTITRVLYTFYVSAVSFFFLPLLSFPLKCVPQRLITPLLDVNMIKTNNRYTFYVSLCNAL